MKTPLTCLAACLSLSTAVFAQDAPDAAPSPGEIVAEAPPEEWTAIAPDDLLMMTLAPAADGSAREVVIQLMPPPFSQGWVANIRTLARAGWYDGISVNRVQDNYVVQWGDPNYDNPEAEGEAKPLPEGLRVMGEEDYAATVSKNGMTELPVKPAMTLSSNDLPLRSVKITTRNEPDPYAENVGFHQGWALAGDIKNNWPVHCYGMVGVGRNLSPDTGSGAELYTVIGHAPRHLDRNIALVGRVVEGIEHLSSLPRGKGDLGFYEDPAKRVPIRSIRVASDLPAGQQPSFEYLSTESVTFARYAEARASRRDPFFIVPAGGADICNIPVPVRRVAD